MAAAGKPDPPGRKRATRMTAAEVAAVNAGRPPSNGLNEHGYRPCGAKLKNRGTYTGKTCARVRGEGTDHAGFGYCLRHGGTSPNGKKHAALERARHELARAKREGFFGGRVLVDPEQALLEEMQRTAGAVRWLEAAIRDWGEFERLTAAMAEADPQAEADGFTERLELRAQQMRAQQDGGALVHVTHDDPRTGLPTLVAVHTTEKAVGFTDTEYRAWLKVYMEERKHLAAVAKACIDADIAERRQATLEARAEMIRTLVLIAFRLAGVTLDEAGQLAIIAEATRMTVKELP